METWGLLESVFLLVSRGTFSPPVAGAVEVISGFGDPGRTAGFPVSPVLEFLPGAS